MEETYRPANQNLFETIISVTGFTPLETDMAEILNAIERDRVEQSPSSHPADDYEGEIHEEAIKRHWDFWNSTDEKNFKMACEWFRDTIHKRELAKATKEIESLKLQVKEKDEKIENLKSVMVVSAEEIKKHWDAHCDKDGYGPANLMNRLENGIASNYVGYKAGAFAKQSSELERLKRFWIPLTDTENYPKDHQFVFARMENEDIAVVKYCDDVNGAWWGDYFIDNKDAKITHWAPIPEITSALSSNETNTKNG